MPFARSPWMVERRNRAMRVCRWADIATVLFAKVSNMTPPPPPLRPGATVSSNPLGMTHAALCAAYLTGEPSMTIAELQLPSARLARTPGHPEYRHTPGLEATTVRSARGLPWRPGWRLEHAECRFGSVVDHHTYVLASDGDLMRHQPEAIAIARHLSLTGLSCFTTKITSRSTVLSRLRIRSTR